MLKPIAQLSTFPHGGAGAAAIRIHRGLRRLGLDSRFYFQENQSTTALDSSFLPLPSVWQSDQDRRAAHSPSALSATWASARSWWQRKKRKSEIKRIIHEYETYLKDNDRHTEVYSQAERIETTRWDWSEHPVELLHLHWTAFAFDWPSLFESLPQNLPIVWTLHDQNPYTGGCHFTTGCRRYETGCGHCPQLANNGPQDLSSTTFALKQRVLAGRNLHIVAPSRWMLHEAQKSPIFSQARSFHHIPYGLNREDLWSSTQTLSHLGERLLPTILFGAENLQNERKGIRYAVEAIHGLVQRFKDKAPGSTAAPFLRLWTFGKPLPEAVTAALDPGIELRQWGFLTDSALQGQLYRAADIFWLPSLEDNQPQTALEAMACGTPVIGFDVGGVPEIVREGVTGLLVPSKDSNQLAEATWALLQNHDQRERLGKQAAVMIDQEHGWERQAMAYRELYYQLLGKNLPQINRDLAPPLNGDPSDDATPWNTGQTEQLSSPFLPAGPN